MEFDSRLAVDSKSTRKRPKNDRKTTPCQGVGGGGIIRGGGLAVAEKLRHYNRREGVEPSHFQLAPVSFYF